MEVIEAKSAGFCFGVARAVKIAQELADSAQTPRMLGSVIHNQRVTEDLARQGMTAISKPEEARAGDTVLLRAHGVGRAVYEDLKARGASVLALTTQGRREEMAQTADAVMTIPDLHQLLLPCLGVVPLQLFAYYVALMRGCDIDKPRNLAKSVTVE